MSLVTRGLGSGGLLATAGLGPTVATLDVISIWGTTTGSGLAAGNLRALARIRGYVDGTGSIGGLISGQTSLSGSTAATGQVGATIAVLQRIGGGVLGTGTVDATLAGVTSLGGTVTGFGLVLADLNVPLFLRNLEGRATGSSYVSAELALILLRGPEYLADLHRANLPGDLVEIRKVKVVRKVPVAPDLDRVRRRLPDKLPTLDDW